MSIGANRLLSVMTSVGNDSASVIQSEIYSGTVTSISPLSITYMDGESKQVTLPESLLILSSTCRTKTIIVSGTIVQLWNNLQVGERVTLLSFNRGQRYYVDRVAL
jgi:hypothetical protein